MRNSKKLNLLFIIVFILQIIMPSLLTNTAYAEVNYPLTFPKVESRPIKEVIRYKEKTILLDHYINYYDQVVDQPIKLIIEVDGKQNIVSDDVQLLRAFKFIGIKDEFAYFVDNYNRGSYIYRVDLNNYTLEKTNESVNNYSNNLNVGVNEATLDSSGNKWFSDKTNYWNFTDANGNFLETDSAFLLYNSLGQFIAYKIPGGVITNYESVGHITPGNNSDVWFTYSYLKDRVLNIRDNRLIHVTKDGIVEEYPIDNNYYIDDIRVDKEGNLYIKGVNWVKEGYNMVKKDGVVLHYTFINGNLQHLKNYPIESNYFTDMDMDINGNLWILDGAKTFKLENGTFNLKSYTLAKMNELSVYDDTNMATFCLDYGYTNITIEDTDDSGQTNPTTPVDPVTPVDPTPNPPTTPDSNSENNNNNIGGDIPSSEAPKPATDILSSDKISKHITNELFLVSKDGFNEVNLDAENIKDGQGSLKMNVDNLIIELPFEAIDFIGVEQGSYISMKTNVTSNDSILNDLNSIGKTFNFSLATYKADGTLIKDIHNFVMGKAKVSVKLNNEDINNLDTNKLAAFYYNEDKNTWELIGGIYNKDTTTFTFETSHFSKYTIAQTSDVLPQTGSSVNSINIVIISMILIGIGTSLILKKKISKVI